MNKSRRDFIKKLPLAMSIPFTLGGISMQAMGQNTLSRLAASSFDEDPLNPEPRVLIVLQMHGGNDGLNCCIPIKHYADYYNMRPNIAIPAANSLRKYIPVDSTLPEDSQIGFHPDMIGMKALYDQGRMTIVQGVSYKNNNGSHFRGRDISFMGGAYNDYFQSGWLGRYLQREYAPDKTYPADFPIVNPDDPSKEMLDPLAIEMGSDVSLIFHQEGNIPTSFSLTPNDTKLDDLGGLEGFLENPALDNRGFPPPDLGGSNYFKELNWILDLEQKTQDYTERLADVYQNSTPSTIQYPVAYPFNAPSGSLTNPLGLQLKVIARLLSSTKPCKTRVFLIKIGGFDTHADQVVKEDTTMGGHAALMYHISTAMKAFQDDLRVRGIEDRVLTVTTSEFGRRVKSNGSYGTDHGTAAPLFIFGKGVQPGILGDAYKTTSSNNLEMQYDYREVYANVMYDWMLSKDDDATKKAKLKIIFPGVITDGSALNEGDVRFTTLPLAQSGVIAGNESFVGTRFSLEDCYPNPAKDETTFTFKVNSAYNVTLNLYGVDGKKTKTLVNGVYEPGEHKVSADLTSFPPGTYIYELKAGFFKEAKKLVIIK